MVVHFDVIRHDILQYSFQFPKASPEIKLIINDFLK